MKASRTEQTPFLAMTAIVLAILVVQAGVLRAMGRLWTSASGTLQLWVGDMRSAELSQQISDWYTFSHIIHGMIFYAVLHLMLPRLSILTRLCIAVGIEAAWEIAENTPWVIEAYRSQALARGYTGDSILNSLLDNVAMMSGFALAFVLPWRATLALAVVAEVAVGWLVRDNLFLNVLGFIHHFEFIEAWQTGVR